MIVKNWIHWTILPAILILTISGCSTLSGVKKVEVSSKPIEIDIIQPTMPRNIDLKDPIVTKSRGSNGRPKPTAPELRTGGKPSTWLPPQGLGQQNYHM